MKIVCVCEIQISVSRLNNWKALYIVITFGILNKKIWTDVLKTNFYYSRGLIWRLLLPKNSSTSFELHGKNFIWSLLKCFPNVQNKIFTRTFTLISFIEKLICFAFGAKMFWQVFSTQASTCPTDFFEEVFIWKTLYLQKHFQSLSKTFWLVSSKLKYSWPKKRKAFFKGIGFWDVEQKQYGWWSQNWYLVVQKIILGIWFEKNSSDPLGHKIFVWIS